MTRLPALVVTVVVCLGGTAATAPPPPRTILLADDHDVLYRAGTRRVLHPLRRHAANPVIARDKPWEVQVGGAYVHRDAGTGKYQMWYQAWNQRPIKDPLSCVVAYAESDDGVTWVKPELDPFPFGDARRTNIVLVANAGHSYRYANAVVVDPRDPDVNKRYKMGYTDWSVDGKQEYVGLHVAFSPDGVRWTKHPEGPVLRVAYGDYIAKLPLAGQTDRPWAMSLTMSDVVDVFWDPRREVFAWYGKMWIDGPDGSMFWKHAMGRTQSKDLIHWDKPQLVTAPDDRDPPHVEFHTSPVFFYNDAYFCLNQILNRAEGGGVIDVELMISRDGLRWERPFQGTPFLPRGKPGAFDAGSLFTSSSVVVLEDEMRLYYGGYSQGATGSDNSAASGVGLATLPRDRFAGVAPAEVVGQGGLEKPPGKGIGQVTMKPVDLGATGGLTLNADASAGEAVRAELLDEEGRLVPGFTRDDAVPVQGDALRHKVAWKQKSLADLPAGKYMIRLHLDRATVYALTLLPRGS